MNNIKDIIKKYAEILRYLIVGGLTTVVSLSTYYACVLTICDPQVAWQLQVGNVVSWVAAVTFAYVVSRKFVFEHVREDWKSEAVAFYSARVATLLLDMLIMFLMVTVMGANDKIAKLVVQVVVTVLNYVLSKFLVFR